MSSGVSYIVSLTSLEKSRLSFSESVSEKPGSVNSVSVSEKPRTRDLGLLGNKGLFGIARSYIFLGIPKGLLRVLGAS